MTLWFSIQWEVSPYYLVVIFSNLVSFLMLGEQLVDAQCMVLRRFSFIWATVRFASPSFVPFWLSMAQSTPGITKSTWNEYVKFKAHYSSVHLLMQSVRLSRALGMQCSPSKLSRSAISSVGKSNQWERQHQSSTLIWPAGPVKYISATGLSMTLMAVDTLLTEKHTNLIIKLNFMQVLSLHSVIL